MKESGEQIAEAMRKNFSLTSMDFSFNDFSYKSFSFISEALKRNDKLLKSSEVDRLKKKIEELQDTEQRLIEVNDSLTQEKEEEVVLYKELEESETSLSRVRHNSQAHLESLQDELESKKAETFETEKKYRFLVERFGDEEDLFVEQLREMDEKTESERRKVEDLRRTKIALDKEVTDQLKLLSNETAPLLEQLQQEENNYNKEKQKSASSEKELYSLVRRIQRLTEELNPEPSTARSNSTSTGAPSSTRTTRRPSVNSTTSTRPRQASAPVRPQTSSSSRPQSTNK